MNDPWSNHDAFIPDPPERSNPVKKRIAVWRIVLFIVLLLLTRVAWGQELMQVQGSFCDTQEAIETLVKHDADPLHKCGYMIGLADSAVKVGQVESHSVLYDIVKVHLVATAIGGKAAAMNSYKFIAVKIKGVNA